MHSACMTRSFAVSETDVEQVAKHGRWIGFTLQRLLRSQILYTHTLSLSLSPWTPPDCYTARARYPLLLRRRCVRLVLMPVVVMRRRAAEVDFPAAADANVG